MAGYRIKVSMVGEFTREQVDRCFMRTPSLYIEKGNKNSGGKVAKRSICSFVVAEGDTDYLTPHFEKYLDDIEALMCGVTMLREMASFESRLSLVVRTDDSASMPNVCLSRPLVALLFKSGSEFDLDVYHYDSKGVSPLPLRE